MLALQFSQNLLKENKAFTLHITDEKELDGLPQTAIDAASHGLPRNPEYGRLGYYTRLSFLFSISYLLYPTAISANSFIWPAIPFAPTTIG